MSALVENAQPNIKLHQIELSNKLLSAAHYLGTEYGAILSLYSGF